MPMYLYKDKNTKKVIEVLRSFDEYETPPSREEATELSDDEYQNAEWERVLSKFMMARAANWGGKKGQW